MSELNPSHHKPGELAVSVQQLGLIYRTTIDKKASLPNRIRSLGRGTKQTRIVNALNEVNLDVDYFPQPHPPPLPPPFFMILFFYLL